MTYARVFAQHLYSQNVQENPARLALANFFNNYLNLEATFDPSMVVEFYQRALEFTYWQKHRAELGQEVRFQLESFTRNCKLDIDFGQIEHPDRTQVIEVTENDELDLLAELYFEKIEEPGEERKVLHTSLGPVILHILPEGNIRVQQLSPYALLRNGVLQPIPGTILNYGENLELLKNTPQRLRLDQYRIATFEIRDDKVHIRTTKGYTFRQEEKIECTHLIKVPKVFYALKRLEKLFIDIQSDPFYKSLVQRLEKAAVLMQDNPQQHLEVALHCYEQGRLLIEEIFTDDKFLKLLVKDLGHHLVSAWNEKKRLSQEEEEWQDHQDLLNANPEAPAPLVDRVRLFD